MPIRLFCFASTALLLGIALPLGAPPSKQAAKASPAAKQTGVQQKKAKAIKVQGAQKSASIKTWQDALAAAYDFSPQIRTARTEVRRTQESKKQAYAEWVPDASGYATYDIEKHNVKKGAPGTTDRLQQPMGYGVRLKQNIFASGGTLARTRKASDAIMASELAMYDKESSVFLETLRAFLEVLVAKQLKEFYKQNAVLSQELFEQTKARFEVGELRHTDTLIAQGKLAESQAKYVEAVGRLAVAKTQLQRFTGCAIDESILVWPDDIQLHLPKNKNMLIQAVLKGNFSVLAAAKQESASRHEVQSQLSGQMLPSVDLQADAGRQFGNTRFGSAATSTRIKTNDGILKATASLNIPLPLGRQQSLVRVAEQDLNARRLNRQDVQLDVRQRALQAWYQMRSARKGVERYKIELYANERALEAMQEEYLQGTRTFVNVSEVQERKEEAYQNLMEHKKKAMLEGLTILYYTGNLTARTLKLRVAYYDPKAYGPWLGLAPQQDKPQLLTDQ
ncbi:MAG: TolC family protein [Holosporaceae bacterium]